MNGVIDRAVPGEDDGALPRLEVGAPTRRSSRTSAHCVRSAKAASNRNFPRAASAGSGSDACMVVVTGAEPVPGDGDPALALVLVLGWARTEPARRTRIHRHPLCDRRPHISNMSCGRALVGADGPVYPALSGQSDRIGNLLSPSSLRISPDPVSLKGL